MMTEKFTKLLVIALSVMIITMGFGSTIPSFADTAEQNVSSEEESTETGNNDARFVKDRNTLSAGELAFDGQYILKNYNKRYVKNEDPLAVFKPVTYMRTNASYTKRSGKEFSEGGTNLSNIISSASYVSMVYDIDPEGDYYVALPDVNRGQKDMTLYSVDVIYNNDQAEVIEDVYFDRETSILYIPKKYIDKPKAEHELFDTDAPVAVQLAYQMDLKILDSGDADFSKMVPLFVFSKKEGDKEYFFKDVAVNNMFDVTTLIPSFVSDPDAYSSEDFSIMLNGMATPVDASQYAYDKKTGEIKLAVQAAAVSSITIAVNKHKTSAAAKLLSKTAEEVFADEDDDETEFDDPADLDSMKALKLNNKYIYVDTEDGDLYDKMYVGWRGNYGDYDSGPDTVLYGRTNNIRDNSKYVQAVEEYLYGAFGMSNAWALVSYATGRDAYSNDLFVAKEKNATASNEVSAYEEIYNTIEKNVSGYTATNKKTIFAWMNGVRTHLSRFVDGDTWTDDNKYYSKAPGKKRGKKNNMGAMMFAFKFPTGVNASAALLDKAELNRLGVDKVPNFGIKFDSDQIDGSNFLPGVCRHFSHKGPHQDGKTSDKAYQTKVFMTCLGKGVDSVGNYLILEFATAEKFSDEDQNGYAVYKFYTTPKGWVKVKKKSSFAAATDNNANYSLAGAKYNVIDSTNKVVGTLVTDAKGETGAIAVPYGNYTIRETEASKGFEVDVDHSINVNANYSDKDNPPAVASSEKPKTGFVAFYKTQRRANGTDSLVEEGATFQIWNAKYDSYEAALAADPQEKRLAQTVTQKKDKVAKSGGLIAGTYKVRQTSAGKQKDVAKWLPEFSIDIKTDQWTGFYSTDGKTAGSILFGSEQAATDALLSPDYQAKDDTYRIDLSIEKLSDDYIHEVFDTCSLNSEEVMFRLEAVEDEDTEPKLIGEKSTDMTGKVTFENLEAGTYKITEIHAAAGYYLTDEIASATIVVGILGDITVIDQISHDGHGIIDIKENKETSDDTVKELIWARKNTPQVTSLAVDKKRSFVNELGAPETEAQPRVEFNLYADGDIVSYDGHGDHVYYKDGYKDRKPIQGIVIDQDTGERTYYVLGQETTEQKYRIITDKKGRWDSLNYEDQKHRFYPLTNNDSHYVMEEQFVWTTGTHITFTEEGKAYLTAAWKTKNTEDTEVAKEMTFRQALNHGIDITGKTTVDAGDTAGATRYSTNGAYVSDEMVNLLNKRVLPYISGASIAKDDVDDPVNIGNVLEHADVIDPSEAADMISEKFQVLPFDAKELATKHVSTFVNDQTPKIGTKAGLKEGNIIKNTGKCAIIDTVAYRNLTPGKKYILKATLYDKETGESVREAGSLVESKPKEFVPKDKDGEVLVEFAPIDTSLISGDVVVFEELYLDGELVTDHKDRNDEAQTIPKEEEEPSIGTTATVNGEKEVAADKEVTITDVVQYKGLKPGKKYVMHGTLMDKSTKKELEVKNNSVSVTFVPEASIGTMEMNFTIDASSLGGKKIVVFEKAYESKGEISDAEEPEGKPVATHEDLDDEGQTVTIGSELKTTAKDKETGTHQGELSSTQTIVDTVAYTGLTPGKRYILSGTLMDKSTKKPLVAQNGEVTKTKSFVPEKSSGTVTLEYTIDASSLAGKTVVVFENVRPEKGDIIARHEIITDPDQSIYYVKIRTTATADGKHSARAKGTVTIEDEVEYWNLVPGKKYTVSGILMDKATGKPLRISGKEVKSTRTFTADKPHSTVTLSFRVKASKLNKKSVVVFERAYTANGTLIGSHEDLNDKGQTVSFMKKVGKVVIEGKGGTPRTAGGPDTGDTTSILLFVVIALVSGGTLATLLMRKRFGKKEE